MRLLVACAECHQQFDVSGRRSGEALHCLCGRTLRVPAGDYHDAAVVRCSSCGAPREERARRCRFCNSDFTLHERDLHTICPTCAARVSDRARFCHHCATPILTAAPAGDASGHACPACRAPGKLTSRSLGDPPLALLECPRCAGMWLGSETFDHLLAQARRVAPPADDRPAAPKPAPGRAPAPDEPLYRPCPICGKLMNRRNFGRKSGVVVDRCSAHGVWFDPEELDAILLWVRRGGESAARRWSEEERRELERRARLAKQAESDDRAWTRESRRAPLADLLTEFIGFFF